jgi:uncharacterized delta-60 repeat protein
MTSFHKLAAGLIASAALAGHVEAVVDYRFNPGSDLDREVTEIIAQPDGRVLVAGAFSTAAGEIRPGIFRFQPDGSLDPSFRALQLKADIEGHFDGIVGGAALQPDGKVLIGGGTFRTVDGVSRIGLARLNGDGTLDQSFNPGLGIFDPLAHRMVLVVQPDGKIVIGGAFEQVNGVSRRGVARLNPDGSLDGTFNPGTGISADCCPWISSIALLSDGRVLIAGNFERFNGTPRPGLARLLADGRLDSGFAVQFAPAAPSIRQVVLQPDGRILVGGSFNRVNGVARAGFARLNADGSLDGTFTSDASVISASGGSKGGIWLQPDGKILVAAVVAAAGDQIMRLHSDGALDGSFEPISGTGIFGFAVPAGAVQPDGKILFGGFFDTVNGLPRKRIFRVNGDGSLDKGFPLGAGGINREVLAVAAQPDGKVLIGGPFTGLNGIVRRGIARLDSNGMTDPTFDPGSGVEGTSEPMVRCIALQPDGKMLVGGTFTMVDGIGRNHIARLHSDGNLDRSFEPGNALGHNQSQRVRSIAVAADGKILVGGRFSSFDGQSRLALARLESDGSLDIGFDSWLTGPPIWDLEVNAVLAQPDGKLLIGGNFVAVDGTPRNGLARLNSDGSLDHTFDPPAAAMPEAVAALALHPDGKVLASFGLYAARFHPDGTRETTFECRANGTIEAVAAGSDGRAFIGGRFTTVNGVPRMRIARLLPNGTPESSIGIGANRPIYALAMQPDGNALVGGEFGTLGGTARNYLARLLGSIPPPVLTLTRTKPGIALSWPAQDGALYVLESTGALSPDASWNQEPQPALNGGDVHRVALEFGGAQRFFRLRKIE